MRVIDQQDLSRGPFAELVGHNIGSAVSLIFVDTDVDGDGPALHRHPYQEIMLIRAGTVMLWIDGVESLGRAGQIVVVPPMTPHRFAKSGPDRLEMIDIHESPQFITEWI